MKVTIKGSSTTKTYSGKEQTYTGTVTTASKDKAFDPSKFHYNGNTVAIAKDSEELLITQVGLSEAAEAKSQKPYTALRKPSFYD